MSVVSRPLSVPINRDCENIFKQLGEMADTYIIFCYIQELSEFYFLYNQQPTTINGLYLIFQRDTKLMFSQKVLLLAHDAHFGQNRSQKTFYEFVKIRFEIFGRYAI